MSGKKTGKSLRIRWTRLVLGVLALLFLLVTGYNLYNVYRMDRDMRESLRQNLHLCLTEGGKDLEKVEDFLVAQNELSVEYGRICRHRNDLEYYLAENSIRSSFEQALAEYDYVDGFYLYNPKTESMLNVSGLSAKMQNGIKGSLGELAAAYGQLSRQAKGKWQRMELENETYLVKLLDNYGMYVGAYVRAESLLARMGLKTLGQPELSGKKEYGRKTVWEDASFGDFRIAVFPARTSFGQALRQYGLWMAGSLLCMAAVAVFLHRQLRNELVAPVNRLVEVMGQPEERLQESLEHEAPCQEFQVVYDAMDEMIGRIRRLDGQIYEERLQNQEIMIQYLQLQTNPHFLINCMNLLCSLISMDEREKAEEVTIELGDYMRYVMRESHLVCLERELAHVESYIRLQKYRYGETLECRIDAENGTEELWIPIMLIQTFVENSVKYAANREEKLQIRVGVRRNGSNIEITAEDNGPGFPQDVLGRLCEGTPVYNEAGEHVGIYNVCRRLELIYRGEAEISFFNLEQGGAGVRILLPGKGEAYEKGL